MTNALDEIVFGDYRPRAIDDARTFYTQMSQRWFDLLEQPAGPDTIDICDLAAVSTLTQRVPWLSQQARTDLQPAIAAITSDPIYQVPESAWDDIQKALTAIQDHVTDFEVASMILTRKRPGLVPIYAPGTLSPQAYWVFWWTWFDYKHNRAAAVRFHHEVGLGNRISVLRVLDAALWMRDWRSQATPN